MLAVVRVLGLVVAVVLGAAILAWLATGERRWLRIAWLIFRYALFALVLILVLFAGEAVLRSS